MRNIPKFTDLYTGRMYEADVFGRLDIKKYLTLRAEALKTHRGGTQGLHELDFLLVKQCQSADPTNPSAPFAKELRLAVINTLNLSDKEADRVRMYSALDTKLDHADKGGIDAFIEYEDPEAGVTRRVTFDVTKNSAKMPDAFEVHPSGATADIIIGRLPDVDEHEDQFLNTVEAIGQAVAKELMPRPGGAHER